MNRPNKKDYCNGWLYNTDKYVASLEKYCDELEIEKGYVQMHADAFLDEMKKQEKEIERLNKALDKLAEFAVSK